MALRTEHWRSIAVVLLSKSPFKVSRTNFVDITYQYYLGLPKF